MSRWQVVKECAWQVLIAADQLVHTIIGLIVSILALLRIIKRAVVWYADETLSSHCWRWSLSGRLDWIRFFIDCLFFWQDYHCKEAYESERSHRHLPPELRGM